MKSCASCKVRRQPTGHANRGFTLLELCAGIAIVGILAAFALPAYQNYAVKSRFSEVILATAPTKSAIAVCATAGDCISGNGSEMRVNLAISPVSTQTCSQTMSPAPACVAQLAAQAAQASQLAQAAVPTRSAAAARSLAAAPAATAANPATACPMTSQQTCSVSVTSSLALLPCVGGSGCAPATSYVSSVNYDANGVITATAASGVLGLKGETFVLTPVISNGRLDWDVSGSCKTRAGGALC